MMLHFFSLKGFLCFLQSAGQLVGARGIFRTAGGALQTGDDLIDLHTLYQRANALEVAVAATDVLDVIYLAVFYGELDETGAGAAALIFKLHTGFPFVFL